MLPCQQGQLTKQHFVFSLVFHVAACVLLIIAFALNKTKKSFIVLGVHSSKDTPIYFRPIRAIKPKDTGIRSQHKIRAPKAKRMRPKVVAKKRPAKRRSIKKKKIAPLKKIVAKKRQAPAATKKAMPKKQEVAPPSEEPMAIDFTTSSIDPRLHRYQVALQKEIARVWRPPVGVPKGTECILQIEVNPEGEVKTFELARKSKVLLYDLSVLQASKDFKFGRALWGNTLLITFRQ